MNMSEVGTSILNGTFPEFQMHVRNKNANIEFDVLYKITRCIHIGDLRMIVISFAVFVVCLASLIATAYTSGQCFLSPPPHDPPNVTQVHAFSAAFSSTVIQLSTGVPADPLRHDRPGCAFFILIAAICNIVIRVLIFSIGLHALEKAKPAIVFSKHIVLTLRNGEPILQLRFAAPTAPALQVMNCTLYSTIVVKTMEGENFGQITELTTAVPSHVICPSFITHTLDSKSVLKMHWLQHNRLPDGYLVVKIGLYDTIKSQYVMAVNTYNLKRDVRLFHSFDDTLVTSMKTAVEKGIDCEVNCQGFDSVTPIQMEGAVVVGGGGVKVDVLSDKDKEK